MAEKEGKKKKKNSQKGWNDANPFQGRDTQVMDMEKVMGNLQGHQKDMFELQRQQGTFGGIRDNRPKGWALDRQGMRTPEEVQARIASSPVTQKPNQHQVASQAVAARKGQPYQPKSTDFVGNRGVGGVAKQPEATGGTYLGYDAAGNWGPQQNIARDYNSVAFDKRNAPAPVGSQQNFFNDGKDLPFGNSPGMAQADQQIANPMNGDLYDQNSQNMSGARNALRNRGGVMVGGKPIQSFQELNQLVNQQGGQMGGFEAFPESPAQRMSRNQTTLPDMPVWNEPAPSMANYDAPPQMPVPPELQQFLQVSNAPAFDWSPSIDPSRHPNMAAAAQGKQPSVAPTQNLPAGNAQVASRDPGDPRILADLLKVIFSNFAQARSGGNPPVTKF